MSDEMRLEIPDEMESEIKQWKNKLEEAKSQIDETLSEEEMKEIIKSLQEKEDDIRSIRQAYEYYLSSKQRQKLYEERNQLVGKCYKRTVKRSDILLYNNINIFAFKILGNIGDMIAECVYLSVENDCRYTIKRDRLGVWSRVYKSIRQHSPRLIDDFEEISEDEFLQLKQEWMEKILDDIQ